MENQIQVTQKESSHLSVSEVAGQAKLVQEVMQAVMKNGQHYGVIPGCGDKPALFKAGAEKLAVTFRLASKLSTEIIDLGNGHREYRVVTRINNMSSGTFICEGVGSCSTMESKYRYRSDKAFELTDKPVPKAYWDMKKSKGPKEAQMLIGGSSFSPKKTDDGWFIAKITKIFEIIIYICYPFSVFKFFCTNYVFLCDCLKMFVHCGCRTV